MHLGLISVQKWTVQVKCNMAVALLHPVTFAASEPGLCACVQQGLILSSFRKPDVNVLQTWKSVLPQNCWSSCLILWPFSSSYGFFLPRRREMWQQKDHRRCFVCIRVSHDKKNRTARESGPSWKKGVLRRAQLLSCGEIKQTKTTRFQVCPIPWPEQSIEKEFF